MSDHSFVPDWASAPGETISDLLTDRGISIPDFASAVEMSPSRAKDLMAGEEIISEEIAGKLSAFLGSSPQFWLRREQQYREDLARKLTAMSQEDVSWLDELPVSDMIRFGWIASVRSRKERLQECLKFFGVLSADAWRESYGITLHRVAFKTSNSFDSSPGAVVAWLRRAELLANQLHCAEWSRAKLIGLVPELRALTRKKDPNEFLPLLQNACASCGVAVVVARAPKGCRASGATRFISQKKAMVLLSFRHLTEDHFWFSFFHEIGHVVLHGESALFLEGTGMPTDKHEKEANRFAEQTIVPDDLRSSLENMAINRWEIVRFARKAGISPGLVVGQLQHYGLVGHHQFNGLKRRFKWV